MTEGTQAQGGSTLLEELLEETRASSPEVKRVYRAGISTLLEDIVDRYKQVERVDKSLVDEMIGEIDRRISRQLDEILHHEKFQKLESAWRGLKLLVDRTDFRANIRVDMLDVSKEQLEEDFEDAPEIVRSGLYRHVYTNEYGVFGGEPYGALIGNYEFSHRPRDIQLLQNIASVAAMAHAPFIAAASPGMFNVERFEELHRVGELKDLFEGPEYTKWRAFRDSEDARYVGLTMPRFLLRLPYGSGNPVRAFDYQEDVRAARPDGHVQENYLWGNTAFAFATRLTDSFARYGWCPNIIGPRSGGAVDDLPVHTFESMGSIEAKIPTEILIPERLDYQLAEEGFIPLTVRKGSDNACFFTANSVQRPKFFGTDSAAKEAETNFKLGTQLPYMFIISRLAHYIKVIQRENIGSWKERTDLQKELENWIKQYVAGHDGASAGVRSRRPLREAQIVVSEVEGEPGWYKVDLKVRPHFKYMGANFTLSLVGKLEK